MVISERQRLDPGARTVLHRTFLHRTSDPEDVVVYCPACKTIETVPFTREGLGRTRKFIQEDNRVYHLCGGTEPCRLLRKI